jgi:hypothetical protein
MPRYVKEMDLLDPKVHVYCGWDCGLTGIDECEVKKQYSLIESDDLVLVTWKVGQQLINNADGAFSFEISIKEYTTETFISGETKLLKQWYSNTNSSLSIQPTLMIEPTFLHKW